MSDNRNPSYPVEIVNHYIMNRVLRHRLRNLCAGVKMTVERIAAVTAASNPQIGSRCDIVISEIDNLRTFTDRMDLLFDALPTPTEQNLFEIVTASRTVFAPKFPFCRLLFDGPEAMLSFKHGSWLVILLTELLYNAGEAAGENGEVKLSWINHPDHFSFTLENNGETIPESIPANPPVPFMTAKSRHDGLGLSIAWRICTAIRAEMRIGAAGENQNTAITITLPSAETNNE